MSGIVLKLFALPCFLASLSALGFIYFIWTMHRFKGDEFAVYFGTMMALTLSLFAFAFGFAIWTSHS